MSKFSAPSFNSKNKAFLIIGGIIVIGLIYFFITHIAKKGKTGKETNANIDQPAYKNSRSSTAPSPANGMGNNEMFAQVSGMGTPSQGVPTASSCSKSNIQNPSELLPKDSNNQWAQLNPNGKGELSNVNLLKAGYHIGIDTISNSLRNANLQLRSEPPNPQSSVGPWNNSTIAPDLMRPSLELGCGPQ